MRRQTNVEKTQAANNNCDREIKRDIISMLKFIHGGQLRRLYDFTYRLFIKK